jgi:D-alanine-D-alanine ligase
LSQNCEILILSGAISSEREVSLRSGRNAYELLVPHMPVRLIELQRNELPDGLDPCHCVIFPLIHGEFGEDGQLQALLEGKGFVYVGSSKDAMELSISKMCTKERVAAGGIPVLAHCAIDGAKAKGLSFEEICRLLDSDHIFLKPNGKGSSIQCFPCVDADRWASAVAQVDSGLWIAEVFFPGRDLTVAVLHGRALPVLEALHGGEFLDYDSKYSVGTSGHVCPAEIGGDLEERLRNYAERAFAICGCRDWARVDFLLRSDGCIFFLELNGTPGFTKTSYFPDCAIGSGISPAECLMQLVQPALERHRNCYP